MIVNTDADNQYYGGDIPARRADRGRRRRHGDRRPEDGHHRALLAAEEAAPAPRQRRGAAAPRAPRVPDTTSGFRAYNREAALQLQVVSKFTYTLESLIQAGKMLVAVDHVPVRTNEQTRAVAPVPVDVGLRAAQRHLDLPHLRALRAAAAVPGGRRARGAVGAVIWVRFAWFFLSGEGGGHVQSLILGSALFVVAVQLAALASSGTSSPAAACSSSGSSSASGAWSCSWAWSPRTTSRAPARACARPRPARSRAAPPARRLVRPDPGDAAREAVKL